MNANVLDRIGARKILQRAGVVGESATAMASDPEEVSQLLAARWYEERVCGLAATLGRDPDSVRAEAAGYLREMAASVDERSVEAWRGFSRWFMRAYDVLVDDERVAELRKLDRKATLAFAFSHRSYLDGMLLPEAIIANRLKPALTYGGANMSFFPFGTVAKRTGAIFIRRQTRDIPVYRYRRCAPIPRSWCKITPTSPGRSKEAGPGPANYDPRCTASCVTSATPWTRSTVLRCIWCPPRSSMTSCTRWAR